MISYLTPCFPQTWIKSFSIITQTNVATLVIALVSMAALIGLNFLNKWLTKKKFPLITCNSRTQRKLSVKWIKWSIPIPAPLVVVSKELPFHFLPLFTLIFNLKSTKIQSHHFCIHFNPIHTEPLPILTLISPNFT